MEFDLNMMSISHSLKNHPILDECVIYKIKYLNVLEYFVNKYSKKDEFALKVLRNYKNTILGEDIKQYSYSDKELKKVSKGVIGVKFKGFKLFTYRYSLVCDCLFINSMMNYDEANEILGEIKSIYRKRYHQKLDLLFDMIYKNKEYIEGIDKVKYQIECLKKNKEYLKQKQIKILTTANMSVGKSTLINALVGKKINRTMNDSCTSKLHYIYNKAFEDGFDYKLDGELNLDADEKVLLNNSEDNNTSKIFISTYFNTLISQQPRLCIVDTPGVNSSMDLEHSDVTKSTIINQEYDKLLYLINAENAGTNDDLKYLNYISQNVDESKIIFVLNKLDRFRLSEDSIEDSINNIKRDLLKLGIKNPIICPISAYAGLLAKKKMLGKNLDEDEQDEYILLHRKFKSDGYNLSKFYSDEIIKKINNNFKGKEKCTSVELLINCGILCLEQIIIEGEEY